MTAFVIKKLVPLAIALATFFVGYNYFYGTDEEKQNSQEIINQVKGLTGSVAKLLGSEKDKYDEGKYDDALTKVKATFTMLKEKATAMGEGGRDILNRIDELEQQEQELESELANLDQSADTTGQAAEIREQILELNQAVDNLSGSLTVGDSTSTGDAWSNSDGIR